MPRQLSPDRFKDLLVAGGQVFLRQGYRQTQIADVAAEAGVAKGTLYLYFESKDALFDAVLRHAAGSLPGVAADSLPWPTPPAGATLAWVRARVAEEASLPALAGALERRRVGDIQAELREIVEELFDKLEAWRTPIKLLDRCAATHPDLALAWHEAGRIGAMQVLTQYVADRMGRGLLRPYPEPAIAARLLLETISTWAVHIHWDTAPQTMDDAVARQHVVRFIGHALLPDAVVDASGD